MVTAEAAVMIEGPVKCTLRYVLSVVKTLQCHLGPVVTVQCIVAIAIVGVAGDPGLASTKHQYKET